MNTSEKTEMLKHTMERYDHYYDSINNKGNLYLTLNTFLFSGIITGYFSIKDTLAFREDIKYLIWTGLTFSLISITMTLWSIIPYLSKQSESINGSALYYGNVSNLSFPGFKKLYNEMTEDKKHEDYLQQVYLLAIGLHNKFRRLQIATYFLGGCFACIIIIGFKLLK